MKTSLHLILLSSAFIFLLFLASCGDDDDDATPPVVTTVRATFTPSQGEGQTIESFEYNSTGQVDDIVISKSTIYQIELSISRDSAGVNTDIDQRIRSNGNQYQIFYTIAPPPPPTLVANFFYLDQDSEGLPIGLQASFATLGAGEKVLTITVKNVPAGLKDEETDIMDPNSVPVSAEIVATYNFIVQ